MFLEEATQRSLRAEARESVPREICGFVLTDGTAHPMRNLGHGNSHYEMDYQQSVYFRIHNKGLIAGTYHSHPSGRTAPGYTDRKQCPWDYKMWIVTADEVWRWERDETGEWTGQPESAFGPGQLCLFADPLRPPGPSHPARCSC